MSAFTADSIAKNDVFIIRSNGYLDDKGGAVVHKAVLDALPKGFQKFILNFSASPVINSQGIAHIIELVEIVVDEKNGKLAYVGLNDLTQGVFKMVGLLRMAPAFPDEEAAIAAF